MCRVRGDRSGAVAELGAARLPGGGILLMNGSDHLLPQAWLGRVVDDANAEQSEYHFSITSLPEYWNGCASGKTKFGLLPTGSVVGLGPNAWPACSFGSPEYQMPSCEVSP